jgi:hypothetical protein
MTDLLDRPRNLEPPASAPVARDGSSRTAPGRWFAAAALVGAAAIHVAMAPSHLGESAVEGAGFLVAAWLQVGLAVALVARPRKWVLWATIASSAGLVAAWAVSRTAGLPFGEHSGHAEDVSLVDGATVGLEVAAALVVLALIVRPAAGLLRSAGVAAVATVGALALTTAAVASPAARDHAAGSHGEHGGAAAAGDGHGHGATPADDLGFAALSNGHQHERGSEPLSPEDTVALSKQLAVTSQLVERYPTLGAAEAAGWTRAGPFSPGLGVHYMGPGFGLNADGQMDPQDLLAPMLIFDGLTADAKLAGFMYLAYGTTAEPEGFAGPNDHWHFHEHVCIATAPDGTISTPFGADLDGVTEGMCTEAGGSWLDYTGYMVHVWNVPGYESPDGTFTELNPAITCADGTYHRIDIAELGDRATTCRDA